MGIKNLWTILNPFCERKPLFELENKKVAIDLSCWVCEAQNIAEYEIQPRMYLRNLYFRTCYLLLMNNTIPVFVLEGKAPELKYQTIAARNALQFKGAKPKKDGAPKVGKDRSRFHFTLKQCQEMLGLMGIACVKGNGEAESLCAYLNEDGLVDGIISQDSDCFAYGAQIVYRNFSISQQGTQAASGGSVDLYDIKKVKSAINFGRNKIIALALLCGCDYSEGVQGVGKESALKLFAKFNDDEILERLNSWRDNKVNFLELEKKIGPNFCASCGHSGKVQQHTKKGCAGCGTTKGCDFTKFREERLEIKNEINIRKKALEDEHFPDTNLITEFLERKDDVKRLDIKWKQPDLISFVKFTVKFLNWVEIYAFEKFLPILTRWQLLNYAPDRKFTKILFPKFIKKTRKPKGVESFEIIWEDTENYFTKLIPDSQLGECEDLEKLWSTIEPQHLVEKAYPKLVGDFRASKVKPKKRKAERKAPVKKITNLLENCSISEPKIKKTKKIDDFFSKDIKSSTPMKPMVEDLDESKFADENDMDLSEIVDGIVNKPIKYSFLETTFFPAKLEEVDLFEESLKVPISDENSDSESDDEFIGLKNYVPLAERLQIKF